MVHNQKLVQWRVAALTKLEYVLAMEGQMVLEKAQWTQYSPYEHVSSVVVLLSAPFLRAFHEVLTWLG